MRDVFGQVLKNLAGRFGLSDDETTSGAALQSDRGLPHPQVSCMDGNRCRSKSHYVAIFQFYC